MSTQQAACFVYGFVLDGQGGARQIPGPVPLDSLGSDEVLWLHIDYSFPDARAWLVAQQLEAHVVDSLVRPDTRPRAAVENDGVLLVLRGVNTNPGADPEDMVSIRMWVEPRRIISVRQRKLLSVVDIREALEAGRGPKSAEEWVERLVQRLADRIADAVDDIEERLAEVEDGVEEEAVLPMRVRVSVARRQTAAFRRFIAPQRDALDALFRASKGTFSEAASYFIREQADRMARYVEDLDLVRERALVIQEELMNRLAQEQNQRMYVLSIVAAIFLPITFITGIFGMNVAGLPGVETTWAFWGVMIAMLGITGGVMILLRRKRWF